MKKSIFLVMIATALLRATVLSALDVMSDEGVKCTYTHHDMWKGKMSGEGMLFVGLAGEKEKTVYVVWGKSRNDLLQKEKYSLKQAEKDKEKKPSEPPWYQEFVDMLKKAVEWEAISDENGLEDVQKTIALGWAYHKLKKGTPGWISRTWGGGGKYEIVEIGIGEVPKLLKILEGVPDLEKKLQDAEKKIQDESDRRKAEEKSKKDKVDSLLK